MSQKGGKGTTEETASGSPQTGSVDRRKTTKIIHVVYLIAALDVTWMFVQFSVTPVSLCSLCQS